MAELAWHRLAGGRRGDNRLIGTAPMWTQNPVSGVQQQAHHENPQNHTNRLIPPGYLPSVAAFGMPILRRSLPLLWHRLALGLFLGYVGIGMVGALGVSSGARASACSPDGS